MILPSFLVVIFISIVDLDRPGAGDMCFIFETLPCSHLFGLVCLYFFPSDIFFRDLPSLIYGKPIPPQCANAKEVREFMMSKMDKQKAD